MDKQNRIITQHGYTLKNLKTWDTRDGGGFQVNLYRDGKAVAVVTNEGRGGEFEFDWRDQTATKVDVSFRTHEGEIRTYSGTPEEAKLWAECLKQPAFVYYGTELHVDPAMFVEELVGDLEVEKAVKKALKYPSIIHGGQLLQFKKHPLDERLRAHIAAKYTGAIVLNDLPLADAVKAYRTAN